MKKSGMVGLMGVIAAGVLMGISFAGAQTAGNDAAEPEVYKSAGDPPVYSLDPVSNEMADRLRKIAGAEETGQVSAADVSACREAEAPGEVDPRCAVILEADRNGDLPATASAGR